MDARLLAGFPSYAFSFEPNVASARQGDRAVWCLWFGVARRPSFAAAARAAGQTREKGLYLGAKQKAVQFWAPGKFAGANGEDRRRHRSPG